MWDDRLYDLKSELMLATKKLVNDRLRQEKLSDEQEDELRQSMTEDIRFWKGW
jgi:hypothetical protein